VDLPSVTGGCKLYTAQVADDGPQLFNSIPIGQILK